MNHLLKENRLKQDEVDTACITIMQRGERVSTNTVHKEVGERGSFSTIQKMVRDWQSRNPVESERVENLPLKADVPESLKTVADNSLKAFWNTARELAYNELEVQRESLKKAENEVNLKMVELQEFSDNQANTIDVLRDQLGQVTLELASFKTALETQQGLTTNLTEELQKATHDLELSRIEYQTLTQRLSEIKALHDKEVDELKTVITQRDADKEKLRVDFETRLKSADEKANSLDRQVTKLQTALDIQANQISEAKSERATALSAEKIAIEQASILNGKLTQVLGENKVLNTENKSLVIKIKELGGNVEIEKIKKVTRNKKQD
jgi:chromosome segregation ATPase